MVRLAFDVGGQTANELLVMPAVRQECVPIRTYLRRRIQSDPPNTERSTIGTGTKDHTRTDDRCVAKRRLWKGRHQPCLDDFFEASVTQNGEWSTRSPNDQSWIFRFSMGLDPKRKIQLDTTSLTRMLRL